MEDLFQKVIQIPLDASRPEYAGNPNPHLATLAYKRFETALDTLPRPTAIICKSATRASVVLAAYLVCCYHIHLQGHISYR